MPVARYRIHVEQAMLDDLHARLKRARFSQLPDVSGWERGTRTDVLRELAWYWHEQFSWHKQAAVLNAMPLYTTRVAGHTLHFVHQRSRDKGALPVLLLHGWPDSFYRYHRVVDEFANPTADGVAGFHVVVPSLPGFPLTGNEKFDDDTQPLRKTAQLVWNLMVSLGYERFAVAGGDTGGTVAQLMALDHPHSVAALYLSDLGSRALQIDPKYLTKAETSYIERVQQQYASDGAYEALQRSRPRALAPALQDSPIALASWILDRFHAWSDHNGSMYSVFSRDELLTNIMLYWTTGTMTSSMLLYQRESRSPSIASHSFISTPTAFALYPRDIGGVPPRQLGERIANVQRWSEMPHGGHFGAWEVPELFINDIRAFLGDFRSAASTSADVDVTAGVT
ncbi:MAG: epoxide hydrolase family protein [Gemmatimonas sp.]